MQVFSNPGKSEPCFALFSVYDQEHRIDQSVMVFLNQTGEQLEALKTNGWATFSENMIIQKGVAGVRTKVTWKQVNNVIDWF
jgi:hypothetical protein